MKLYYFQLVHLISSYPILDYLYPSASDQTQPSQGFQYNYDDYVGPRHQPVHVLDYSMAGNVHKIEMKFERRLDRLELVPSNNNHTFVPANLMKESGQAYAQVQEVIKKAGTREGMEDILNEIYKNEFKEETLEVKEAEENSPQPIPGLGRL
jgi:hypothetical protein